MQFVKRSDIISKSLEESTNNRKVWKHRKKLLKVMKEISKNFLKTFKKSVDKRKWMWYNNSRTVERGSVRTDKKLSKKCVGPWKLNNEKDKGTRNTLRILKDLQWDAHNKASEITDTLVFGMSD